MEQSVNMREVAMLVLLDVEQKNKMLNESLHNMLKRYQYCSKTDRAFLSRLCEGVVERQIYLDYIINAFSKTKVNKCKPLIRVLLRMAVYQMFFMDSVPDEAACNEAVKLAKKKGFHSLSGFVNGVLRNIARNKSTIAFPNENDNKEMYLSVMYSTPEWLVTYLLRYYDYETVKGMLQAFMAESRTTIRLNQSKCNMDELKRLLSEKQVETEPSPYVETALRLTDYNYMRRVPGFSDGLFGVQDESSMLVGVLANPKAGDMIIDMCAAPGGKTLDVADRLRFSEQTMHSDVHGVIISRDVSQQKIDKIQENLERMEFDNVRLEVKDACELDEDMVEQADIVICDVPCSGIGVIGRKQDIKYRLEEKQLSELVTLQRAILANGVQYVKPGGTLMFSTCTVNPKENEENREWLLSNFSLEPVNITKDLPEILRSESTDKGYLSLIPGKQDCDGFFIAKFKKI